MKRPFLVAAVAVAAVLVIRVVASGDPPSGDPPSSGDRPPPPAPDAGTRVAPVAAVSAASPPATTPTPAEPAVDAALEAHDFAEAWRLLSGAKGRDDPARRFLRGWVAHALRNDRQAAEELAAARGAFPEIEDYRLHALANARLAAGDGAGAAEAAQELETSFASSRFANQAPFLRGRAMAAAGSTEQAVALLTKLLGQPAVGGVDRPSERAVLAKALEARGAREAAVREWRTIAVSAPEHARARDALQGLARLAPEQPLTPAERLRRAERLLEKKKLDETIAELDLLGASPQGVRPVRLKWLRAMSLYKMRGHYDDAARLLREVASTGGPEAEEAAFLAARALARAHHDTDAATAFRRFARRYPASANAEEAQQLAALSDLEGGRTRSGVKALQKLEKVTKDVSIRQDARWRVAFAQLTAGKARAAIPLLDAYATDAEQTMERNRGIYWGAVARLQAKRLPDGTSRLRRLVVESPLHYYGLLARQRLVALGEDPGLPFGGAAPLPTGWARTIPDAEPPLPAVSPPTPAVATLLRLGLRAEAEAEIARAQKGIARGDLINLYRTAHATERLYHLASDTMGTSLYRAPTGDARLAWALAYPRPYRALVEEQARAHAIPEHYLYAIMRQESSFDPTVVSYANAIGLLQMLPQTARRVAADSGTAYDEGLLYTVAGNVRLGARYIGGLLRRFRGQAPLAIAAFNGGPHNVDLWLGRFGDRPTDEFVESIPFDQTRNYVRRVLTGWAHYRFLYGGTGDWPLEIPTAIDRTRASGPDY